MAPWMFHDRDQKEASLPKLKLPYFIWGEVKLPPSLTFPMGVSCLQDNITVNIRVSWQIEFCGEEQREHEWCSWGVHRPLREIQRWRDEWFSRWVVGSGEWLVARDIWVWRLNVLQLDSGDGRITPFVHLMPPNCTTSNDSIPILLNLVVKTRYTTEKKKKNRNN